MWMTIIHIVPHRIKIILLEALKQSQTEGEIRSLQSSWDVKLKAQNISSSFANCFSSLIPKSKQSSEGYQLFPPMQQRHIDFSIN